MVGVCSPIMGEFLKRHVPPVRGEARAGLAESMIAAHLKQFVQPQYGVFVQIVHDIQRNRYRVGVSIFRLNTLDIVAELEEVIESLEDIAAFPSDEFKLRLMMVAG
jgi:hypothetical protein